jgi:hypothetical protein
VRLTAADPPTPQWQRFLFVSHARLGDLALAAGDPTTAAGHYHHALAIAEQLVAVDATNAQWKRDLTAIRQRLDQLSEPPAGSA